MIVGVCRVTLMVEASQSLKDKRAVLKRIKDRVNNTFNCAIAEVGDNDEWQSSQIGFAVVSNELGFTQSVVQKILQFVEDLAVAKVIDDEQDYLNYGAENLDANNFSAHWEPDEPSPMKGTGRTPPPKRNSRPKLGVSWRDRGKRK